MQHLAIIMDGNGRWAEYRHLPRTEGHKQGAKAFINLLRDFVDFPLNFITVYAFSTENNIRNKEEVSNILNVIAYFLKCDVIPFAIKHNITIKFIGDIDSLPSIFGELKNKLPEFNSGKVLTIALNYGGINEVYRAINKLEYSADHLITERDLLNALDTAYMPNPEAVLRYGGHKRLSNFMPLQTIYSELFFIDKLWPDYQKEDIKNIIDNFENIKRNFGGTND